MESEPGAVLTLKKKGVFDLNNLYKTIYDWFETRDFEFHDKKHKAKKSGEHECEIVGFRKESEFHMAYIEIGFHIWDIEQVEVIENNTKKQKIKGRLFLWVENKVLMDYSNSFTSSRFRKGVMDLMQKYVLKRKKDSIWTDQTHYWSHDLFNAVKESLDMETKGSEFADVW